jgi:hypothetical protein
MSDNLLIEIISVYGDHKADVLFASLKQEVSQ